MPARTRSSEARRGPAQRTPVWDAAASFGVAVSFLAGLWLIMAPFALGYRTVGDEFTPQWNTAIAGFAVAVCSLIHAMAPRETPWLGPVLLLIGSWLVASSAEQYPGAGLNDAVTGAVVVVAALGTVARAVTWRRGDRHGPKVARNR